MLKYFKNNYKYFWGKVFKIQLQNTTYVLE